MAIVRINGTLRPVRQRVKVSYDPQHGLQIGVPWESAGAGLAGVAQAYQNLRIAYDFEPNLRKSTLIAKPTGGQLGIPNVAVDEWQLLPNEQQLSIMYLPAALALSESDKDTIADGINNNKKASETGLSGDALQIYQRLRDGQTHFPIGVPVLRHTTNVWDGYPGNVANVNVDRIYTTEQVVIECGPTRGWVYPIPNGIVGGMQAAETFFSPRSGWLIGWRKLPPNWATAAGNRISVTTEYWFGQHDLFIYGTAVL